MLVNRSSRVLLTGATGFVGSHLVKILQSDPRFDLTCAVRRSHSDSAVGTVVVPSLNDRTDWSTALANKQVVVHAAARAHVMEDEAADPLSEYRRVNVDGTLNLARQAAAAGVKRFVFISSIKVNGERTPSGHPFQPDAQPSPEDAYGISKMEAEQGLTAISGDTGMELVVLRPPLVYGPGVKGNFNTLLRAIDKGIPLPLGAIRNKRSLVGVDNLVDLIITCMHHPQASNQVFLAADGEDVSTTELLRLIAEASGKPCRLLKIPPGLLMFAATLAGKKEAADRLLGSLQIDVSKTREMLGWRPPLSVREGLARCFSSEKVQ